MTFAEGGRLAQARLADTSAHKLYTAILDTGVIRVVVCNTSNAAATFALYHTSGGATPDETHALFWKKSVAAGESFVTDEPPFCVLEEGDELHAQSSVASALTFTIYGDVSHLRRGS